MDKEDLYRDREQSLVKHAVLRNYLQRFAHIVLSRWESITYIDCFSGPWQSQSQRLEDTSFSIALHELLAAQATHASKRRETRVRCVFIEEDRQAFTQLERFSAQFKDRAAIRLHNQTFAESIGDILEFIKSDRATFPFLFIDPTGWTGFGLDVIRPLLQLNPAEVLINYMTEFIRRFIVSNDPTTRQSFERMYGSSEFLVRLMQMPQEVREEAAIDEYSKTIKQTGMFDFVGRAIVLHPEEERTYFHLLYATRNQKGLEVFKGAEKRATEVQDDKRSQLVEERISSAGQGLLFSGLRDSRMTADLKRKHSDQAKQKLRRLLHDFGTVTYDLMWECALVEPLIQEEDLRRWIANWSTAGTVRVDHLQPRQRVLQRSKGNQIVLIRPHDELT